MPLIAQYVKAAKKAVVSHDTSRLVVSFYERGIELATLTVPLGNEISAKRTAARFVYGGAA